MPRTRPYVASDWDAFCALEIETAELTLKSTPDANRDGFAVRWAEQIRSAFGAGAVLTQHRDALIVLEDDDGTYAGHLWLCEMDDPLAGTRRLYVRTVAVVARFRSRGWGRLLMKRAEDGARARRLGGIALMVAADNVVARKLYDEMGFAATQLMMVKKVDA